MPRHTQTTVSLGAALLTLAGLACSPGSTDPSKLPPDVPDPASLHTAAGAMEFYRGVLGVVPRAVDQLAFGSGILTDELMAMSTPQGLAGPYTLVDARMNLTGLADLNFKALHNLRAQAREGRGLLTFAPDSSPALTGQLYAIEAYADLLLADVFCSGIPLSTMDFNGDYTLAAGSSTSDVYRAAVALFDSALVLTGDSARFRQLAAVGRGRALLALGLYENAAAAVADVPDDYTYPMAWMDWALVQAYRGGDTILGVSGGPQKVPGLPIAGDREGFNGLDYRSSGDPRTSASFQGRDLYGNDVYIPDKYPFESTTPFAFMLASGLEARLIEAEAALNSGSADWLTKLNTLRTDGTYDTQPNPNDPNRTDTLWHAGTGGVPGLRPLEDPGDADQRVNLLFRERAFWLYLTAHRQGDLRRLIRQYHRLPDGVYPTGIYRGGTGTYGEAVVVPVPESEQVLNPKYTGCLNGNA